MDTRVGCSIDWSAVSPNAPVWVNTTRQQSQVTLSRLGTPARTYLFLRGAGDDLMAPSKGFFLDEARNVPAAERRAIATDLKACAALQPRGSNAGVQLRRTADALAK